MTAPPLLRMVRVCREFQKYTGHDTPIVYNIDSQYAPKFHIHPTLLASDFFERRTQFYDKLKKVVHTVETNEDLLDYIEDEEVSLMLHHFGVQTVITKVNHYKKELIKKKLHNEDASLNLNKLKIDDLDDSDGDIETIKERLSCLERMQKHPLQFILWIFLKVRSLQKARNKSIYALQKMYSYMLVFAIEAAIHRKKLHAMIRRLSISQLQKKLKAIKWTDKEDRFANVDKKQMILICNDLRSWTKNGTNGILKIAQEYSRKAIECTAKHFFSYYDCKLCHQPHTRNTESVKLGVEIVKQPVHLLGDHNLGKTLCVVKICIVNDLITRVEELNDLVRRCVNKEEVFIACKLLRCSFKLCSGYIVDETMKEEEQMERIGELSEIWWETECGYCDAIAENHKHKACTGCMKVVYCSRKCQKMDWNEYHRNECDKSWRSIYGALKMTIIDRM
eukprot:486984_1